MGKGKPPKWSAFEVGLVTPRQNGKNGILEARELAGLFLFGERLILHSAHEFKTAQEAFRRVMFLVENNDDLRKRVARVRTSHGEEGIELRDGARLRFIARSTGSGRGFSADCVILDESYALSSEAMGALLPTLSALPNPQVWYTSSAGKRDSTQLMMIRDRGRAGGDPGLAYFEWSAPLNARPTTLRRGRLLIPRWVSALKRSSLGVSSRPCPSVSFAVNAWAFGMTNLRVRIG